MISIHIQKNDLIFVVLAFQGTHANIRAERQRWVFILRRKNVEVFVKSVVFFFILKKVLGACINKRKD